MENENKNLNDILGEENANENNSAVINTEESQETEVATETETLKPVVEEPIEVESVEVESQFDNEVNEDSEKGVNDETTTSETMPNETMPSETIPNETTPNETTPSETDTKSAQSDYSEKDFKASRNDKIKKKPFLSVISLILAFFSFSVIVGLIFTPFFSFSYKRKVYSFAPSRIFDDNAKMFNGWPLDETATIIFLLLFFFIVLASIMLLKSIIGTIRSNKKSEIYAQKVVFLSYLLCSVYFLASLITACVGRAFLDTKIYHSQIAVVPFFVSTVLFIICGVVKKKIVKTYKDEFYFHGKFGRRFGFVVTIILMAILNILTLASLSKELFGEALLLTAFSTGVGISLCVRFRKDLNKQAYLDYLAMKKKMSSTISIAENSKTNTTTTEKPVAVRNATVSERLLAIEKQNGGNIVYGDFSSTIELANDFIEYAKTKGVGVNYDDAINLFSAMSCSRTIWLNGSKEYLTSLLNAVKTYFGSKEGVFIIDESVTEEKDLITANATSEDGDYKFIEELYLTKLRPNSVFVSVFSGANGAELDNLFASFVNYFRAPNYDNEIDLSAFKDLEELAHIKNSKFVIPSNWWCFFINEDENNAITLSFEQCAISINILDQTPVEIVPTEKEFNVISTRNFLDIVSKAIEKNFISLDVWNKFDKIIDFLKSISDFSMSNHIYRQIETYSAVLVSYNGDSVKALDAVIRNKIIPCYAKSNKVKKGEKTVSECIDNAFGLENMPETAKIIIDLGLDG